MKRNKLALPIVKIIFTCSIVLSILFTLAACNKEAGGKREQSETLQKPLTLATTTSLNDSGLLDYLKPVFEKETSIPLKIIAQGTGQAIKTGENGDADVLFVHDKKSEEKFITDGFGVKRIEVMHNYFVIVGPKEDPAKIKGSNAGASGAADAFKLIAEAKSKFVSRGDDSGTNKKEKSIWTLAGVTPSGDWYISAGKGMGDVLKMSSELSAYTLSDKSTYLSMKDKLQLDILLQNAPDMKNVYTLMAVNKEKHPSINSDGANQFIKWMTSDKALSLIKAYGKEKYGEALFTVDFIK